MANKKRTWGGWKGVAETEVGERVIGSWVASIPFKRWDAALEGGNLILTERHLLFKALRTPVDFGDVITLSGGKRPRWIVPVSEIRSVERVPDRRSQLRIETTGDEGRNFIIAARRLASRKDEQSAVTRDEVIARIRAAV